MGKVYSVFSRQNVPVSLEEVWAFFSDAKNLAAVTPPHLNLKVTNEVYGGALYPGQVMTYKVKPLLGIPIAWMTEITHVEPMKYFVDEQRKGPYKLWHHQHHFKKIEGGVEMTDLVHYRLPLGILGSVANSLLVKSELNKIFAYRYQRVIELFGKWKGEQMELRLK
ncbi:MAG TPA: SRPBCC family protein [Flavisolibacter sp.]|jgi:ligand-binding SRPBCC domain-containing protein|nr:SRPBCC family protein [Flavisolibacter sp.]